MGSSAYTISAVIAVQNPMPKIGMRIPKSARLGIVWNTPASPSTGGRHAGRRVSTTPRGIPTSAAAPVESTTKTRC